MALRPLLTVLWLCAAATANAAAVNVVDNYVVDTLSIAPHGHLRGLEETPPKAYTQAGVILTLGVLIMVFSARQVRRINRELGEIKAMYDAHTTVKGLREQAESGQDLPKIVIIAGRISCDGGHVRPVAIDVAPLAPLVGTIDQMENGLVEIANSFKDNAKVHPDDRTSVSYKGHTARLDQLGETAGYSPEDVEEVEDDYSKRKAGLSSTACVLTELLVTRQYVSVHRDEYERKDGSTDYEIKRYERSFRQNTHHVQQRAIGIHLVGMENEGAAMEVPMSGSLEHNDVPALFLPIEDAIHNFFQALTGTKAEKMIYGEGGWSSNSNKHRDPFSQLSKFVYIDVASSCDDGSSFKGGNLCSGRGHALGELAAVTAFRQPKAKWFWYPQGYYDKPEYALPEHSAEEEIGYATFSERLHPAAAHNAHVTVYKDSKTPINRDKENAFRIVELAIPDGEDVTIVACPVHTPGESRPIKLCDPQRVGFIKLSEEDVTNWQAGHKDKKEEASRYDFRILKGHGVENLLKQRKLSKNAYIGLGILGAFIASLAPTVA